MRKSMLNGVCLVVVMMLMGAHASPAFARQAPENAPAALSLSTPAPVIPTLTSPAPPRGFAAEMIVLELFGGLLFGGTSTAFTFGGGGEKPITARLIGGSTTAITGEVSLARADAGIDLTATTFSVLGGLAIRSEKAPDMKIKPFGKVMAGFTRSGVSGFGSSTAFAIQFGGGIDYEIKPDKMMLRIRADIPIAFFEGSTETGFRVTGGIAIPIGG